MCFCVCVLSGRGWLGLLSPQNGVPGAVKGPLCRQTVEGRRPSAPGMETRRVEGGSAVREENQEAVRLVGGG